MNIFVIIGCSFVLAVLVVLLHQTAPAYAVAIAAGGGVIISLYILHCLAQPLQSLLETFGLLNVENSAEKFLLKTVGICIVCRFASNLCQDFGQSSLAVKIETAGRVAVFALSVPFITEVLNTALKLM